MNNKENPLKMPIYKLASIEDIETKAESVDGVFSQGKDPLEIVAHYHPDNGVRISRPRWNLWNIEQREMAKSAKQGVDKTEDVQEKITKENVSRYWKQDPKKLEN